MARLLHLNGLPGIGKSTLARRYVADHPGVLCCDIDVLRTMVGGWRDDFVATGGVIRAPAQAMIGAHLAGGRDVVLPQLIARDGELAGFEQVARASGASYVHVLLTDERDAAAARFERRGGDDPWHDQVRAIVAEEGGVVAVLEGYRDRLDDLVARRPDTVVVRTVEGRVDAAYDALLRALVSAGG